jgi:hypothetical protein
MKPLKRIAILFIAVVAIALLWLVPGINTAKDVTYTRIYEDTNNSALPAPDTTGRKVSSRQKINTPVQTKKYKRESIKSGAKISDMNAKVYSRAIHFTEEKIIEFDSLEEVQLTLGTDSVKHL